ncbi:hypothetical protein GCM10027168_24100 [Streptomyces capparidis]
MTNKAAVRGGSRPTPPAAPPGGRGPRVAAYVLLAVLGVLVAGAGALVQEGWFPFGLLLALLASGALFYGGTTLTRTRAGAVVPAAAWMVTVIYLTISRPEGDQMFTATLGPYVFLLVGALTGVMSATLPQLPPHGGDKGGAGRP